MFILFFIIENVFHINMKCIFYDEIKKNNMICWKLY